MDVKYVYTLSSRKFMVKEIIKSIKSLKDYTDSENIIVFATSPTNPEDLKIIRELGVEVRKKSHVSESFSVGASFKSHFCDKIHLTEVESENVVFLTVIPSSFPTLQSVLGGI